MANREFGPKDQVTFNALTRVTKEDFVVASDGSEHTVLINPKPFRNEMGMICISAEDGADWADYYGEFRGGYPWIAPELERFASKHGLYWEWENPGCIILTD